MKEYLLRDRIVCYSCEAFVPYLAQDIVGSLDTCIALFSFQHQGCILLSCESGSDERYIPFQERDTALFCYFQNAVKLDLVVRQREILHPILLGARDVINEDIASSNPLFSPMLHTNTHATAVHNLCTSHVAIEDPLIRPSVPRHGLR